MVGVLNEQRRAEKRAQRDMSGGNPRVDHESACETQMQLGGHRHLHLKEDCSGRNFGCFSRNYGRALSRWASPGLQTISSLIALNAAKPSDVQRQ